MRMDKMTNKLQSAFSDAQSLALKKENSQIDPLHLLLSLIEQKGGTIRPLLAQIGFNISELENQLINAVELLPTVTDNQEEVSVSQELVKLLNKAEKFSHQQVFRPCIFVRSHLSLSTFEAARLLERLVIFYLYQPPQRCLQSL